MYGNFVVVCAISHRFRPRTYRTAVYVNCICVCRAVDSILWAYMAICAMVVRWNVNWLYGSHPIRISNVFILWHCRRFGRCLCALCHVPCARIFYTIRRAYIMILQFVWRRFSSLFGPVATKKKKNEKLQASSKYIIWGDVCCRFIYIPGSNKIPHTTLAAAHKRQSASQPHLMYNTKLVIMELFMLIGPTAKIFFCVA